MIPGNDILAVQGGWMIISDHPGAGEAAAGRGLPFREDRVIVRQNRTIVFG